MEVATATGTICSSENNHRNYQKPSSGQTDTTAIGVVANHNHHSTIVKPLSFTNGVLKRRSHAKITAPTTTTVIMTGGGTESNVYKECLKNHAASLGGHALDGCGEFMPSPNSSPANPALLKCAVCGCHRNFHRRDLDDTYPLLVEPTSATFIEYQPHHRHHPPAPSPVSAPAPLRRHSPSPPPISSTYYPSSAPHMLLALSSGGLKNPLPATTPEAPAVFPPENPQSMNLFGTPNSLSNLQMMTPNGRKRFRTKFSTGQKEKMLDFAEKVGWKMQKRDEEIVTNFCNEIGVEKNVLKVWMHNNKSKSATEPHHIQQHGNGNGIGIGNGNGNGNSNVIRDINVEQNTPININTIAQNHMNMNNTMNMNNIGVEIDDDDDDNEEDEDLTSSNHATNGSSSS